jgi:hypothetical protein
MIRIRIRELRSCQPWNGIRDGKRRIRDPGQTPRIRNTGILITSLDLQENIYLVRLSLQKKYITLA